MFNAVALKGIIQNGGVPYRTSATSYIFACPRCQKEDKLWMYKESGFFKCWVCESEGFRGGAEKALVELFGGTYQEYGKILRGFDNTPMDYLDIDFGEEDDDEFIIEGERLLSGWEWPPTALDHTEPGFQHGREYLATRGISEDIIKKYDIRYSPGENRVMFPYVVGGELVGWQGRLCGPDKVFDTLRQATRIIPKALTTLQADIQTQYVMCADNLLRSPHAVITEGPITCFKAELCGGNVATLGKGMSEEQLLWIAKRVRKVYLALDPDAGADVERVSDFLRTRNVDVLVMKVPPDVIKRLSEKGKKADFGDCTPEEVYQAFLVAEPPGELILSLGNELIC